MPDVLLFNYSTIIGNNYHSKVKWFNRSICYNLIVSYKTININNCYSIIIISLNNSASVSPYIVNSENNSDKPS